MKSEIPKIIDSKFIEEARLKEHCFFDHKHIDVVMHSKINNSITLRKVTDQDFEITFQWATNKDIRQYSIQKKEIGYDEHEKWFFSKIQADDCYYYIAIYEDILNNYDSMAEVIMKELDQIKKEYGTKRRTVIENAEEVVYEEKKMEEMEVTFLMDRFGYMRTIDKSAYERNKEAANAASAFAYLKTS